MNREQDEALELAKLAAMVGSQLKSVDQLMMDRTNNPANKINLNNFIAKVKNPNVQIKPASYLTNVPEGFAAPLPEEYIQSQVPDTSVGSKPTEVFQPAPQLNTNQILTEKIPQVEAPISQEIVRKPSQQLKNVVEQTNLITRSDIDSIRNSLKNIDKTLSGVLNWLKNSKSDND